MRGPTGAPKAIWEALSWPAESGREIGYFRANSHNRDPQLGRAHETVLNYGWRWNASGHPPYRLMISSISFMRRIVSAIHYVAVFIVAVSLTEKNREACGLKCIAANLLYPEVVMNQGITQ
jgi:hypothetical protein